MTVNKVSTFGRFLVFYYYNENISKSLTMKTALFLSNYDLSTVHYLCSYYIDNANLDRQDVDYITELQNRVENLMEVSK